MPGPVHAVISAELAAFFESGVSVLVGTRDARLFPECLRGVGARVEPGGAEVTVFVPKATSAQTVANLKDNDRVAICFERASDHRSIQVKGSLASVRDARAADRAIVDRYVEMIAQEWGFLGLPPRITHRMTHWPCHALRMRAETIFVQTPGPGAGEPIAPHSGGRAR